MKCIIFVFKMMCKSASSAVSFRKADRQSRYTSTVAPSRAVTYACERPNCFLDCWLAEIICTYYPKSVLEALERPTEPDAVKLATAAGEAGAIKDVAALEGPGGLLECNFYTWIWLQVIRQALRIGSAFCQKQILFSVSFAP